METIGKKTGFWVGKLLKSFNPYSHKPAWGKRLERKAFPSFHYISVWLISSQYGNTEWKQFSRLRRFRSKRLKPTLVFQFIL